MRSALFLLGFGGVDAGRAHLCEVSLQTRLRSTARVLRHPILSVAVSVHELDDHSVADAIDMAVAPLLERSRRRRVRALPRLAGAGAGRMGLEFIGRSVHDVDASPIGFQTRDDAIAEPQIGVREAPV